MDEFYRPVWEKIGAWKKIEPGDNTIKDVYAPYIGKDGDLKFNEKYYLPLHKIKKS